MGSDTIVSRQIAQEEVMTLKSVKQESKEWFVFQWDDGHVSRISAHRLRDRCPCAGCAGESVLFQTYTPPPADTSVPGFYEVKSMVRVGSYALKIGWGDGHDLGLYTWEHLRRICQCEECEPSRGAAAGA
jgi:DUF971 family protein